MGLMNCTDEKEVGGQGNEERDKARCFFMYVYYAMLIVYLMFWERRDSGQSEAGFL